MNKNKLKQIAFSLVTVIILTACGGGGTTVSKNKAPISNPQNIILDKDTNKSIILSAIDVDDDTLIYTVVTQPVHGILIGTAPNLTYVPTADYFGADTFTFKVNDGTVDSAIVTVTLRVNGILEPNRVKPVITLNGDANISLYIDSVYTELNATAIDDIDGDITSNIVISGSVDTTSLGIYILTYSVNDGAGNKDNITRTVNILSNLRKTGQTTSYDVNGNIVADGTQKDDGFYQKGMTSSFMRDDANEIVTDNLTGLMWQDDSAVASVTKQWLTDINYNICSNNERSPACFDTTGDTAITYCTELVMGGYEDWKLPTIEELEQLPNYRVKNPALDTIFEYVSSSDYWSSSTIESDEGYAWLVDFNYGYVHGENKVNNNIYVRCVRNR